MNPSDSVLRSVGARSFAAAWIASAAIAALCAGDSIDARSTQTDVLLASAGEWMFAAIWTPSAGPGFVQRDEVWVGLRGEVKWRRLLGRDVLFAQDATVGPEIVGRVRAAALVAPPILRQRGDRLGAVDARIGSYMSVVIGQGERFARWSDEETFFVPELATAVSALIRAAQPKVPRTPSEPAWLQALPLDPTDAAAFERDGLLVRIESSVLATNPVLSAVAGAPFSWVALPAPRLAVGPGVTLTANNPAVPLLLRDRPFQLQLQITSPRNPL